MTGYEPHGAMKFSRRAFTLGCAEARIVILGKFGLSISLQEKSAITTRPSPRRLLPEKQL
jgi:hypothetical protein